MFAEHVLYLFECNSPPTSGRARRIAFCSKNRTDAANVARRPRRASRRRRCWANTRPGAAGKAVTQVRAAPGRVRGRPGRSALSTRERRLDCRQALWRIAAAALSRATRCLFGTSEALAASHHAVVRTPSVQVFCQDCPGARVSGLVLWPVTFLVGRKRSWSLH